MLIDLIVGARPNFIKIAPIIRAIKSHGKNLEYRLIHTGQHYDEGMSKSFFGQLNIPSPNINFNISSGSPIDQISEIMRSYVDVQKNRAADYCLVVGDVNSTMACALSAAKINIPVIHVEAGIRSGDWDMPEEINRIVTDSISSILFTTTRKASTQLKKEGKRSDQVFMVGNVMIDSLHNAINSFKAPNVWVSENLSSKSYAVITIHRPSNVDDAGVLKKWLVAVADAVDSVKLIFPVHPRTRKSIEKIKLTQAIKNRYIFCDPLPYLEFLYLVKNSLLVITDSGGLSEETTVMRVPCFTLRNSTERPETITQGTNSLVGTDPSKLSEIVKNYDYDKETSIPELWDGNSSVRIIEILNELA